MNAISQISSDMSAALAVDLAADIWEPSDVFTNHGVDPIYGAALLEQEWFVKMVEDAKREWSSIGNAKQRIRLKSQLAVEMGIQDLYTVVSDVKIPAAARVAAFKELKDLSGAAAPDPNGAGAAGPSVNIIFDGKEISISAQEEPSDADIDTDVVDVEFEETKVTRGNLDFIGIAPL